MIHEKTVIARFNISSWTARKHDKKVTAKVESEYNAHDAGRFNKILIAEDAIQAYQSIAGEARAFHYSLTLPWGDNGDRLLPIAVKDRYTHVMDAFRARFIEQVEIFKASYPSLIDEARRRLNGMFNDDDYPEVWQIGNKFDFAVRFYPVPSSGDFRVNLSFDEIEAMKAELSKETNSLKDQAIRALWERIYYPVARMVERLSKSDAIFRDSLIGNVHEVLDVIDALNFEEVPEITECKRRIADMLQGIAPEMLRGSNGSRHLRERVADLAMGELKNMANVLGLDAEKTVRKIRVDMEGKTPRKTVIDEDTRQLRIA